MRKLEKLLLGCTFFISGVMLYSLSVLTNDHSLIYLTGIGLPILGLVLMYLGITGTDEDEQ